MPANSVPIFSPQGELWGTVLGYQSYDQLFLMETRFTKPTVVPRHRHANPHFMLVLGGGFETDVADAEHHLSPGEAIFHEAGLMHRGRILTDGGRALVVELTRRQELPAHSRGLECYSRHTRIPSLLAQIYRESRIQDQAQRLAIEGLLLLVLAALLREAEPAAAGAPQWIDRAAELLRDSACESHTMDELSRELGVDQKEISACFRKYLQCTPSEYQRTQRLEIARKYLADSNFSIARVASETGFCDQAYFCHEFKRTMNCTPSEYRSLFQRRKANPNTELS